MDYKRFQIGDWVCSDFVIVVGFNDGRRVVTKFPQKVWGKVTGLKRFFLGRVNPGYSNEHEGDCCQGYLSVESSIAVWEVKQGKFNKPAYVQDEDISKAVGCIEGLPSRYIRHLYKWTDQARADMREEMHDWPRDSKGRWTSVL